MSEEVQLEALNTDKQDNNIALNSNVSQDISVNTKPENQEVVKIKKPRRVLHFSDGTLEEYSTDEEDDTDAKKESSVVPKVEPVKLTWGPWMWYWTLYTGSTALAACDYVGESLGNFLGITSPKYQYEIEEFRRMQEDEENEKKEQEEQMAGWTIGAAGQADKGISAESDSQLTTKQPSLKRNTASKYTVEEISCQQNNEIPSKNINPELPINKLNLNDSQSEEKLQETVLNNPSTDDSKTGKSTNESAFMQIDSTNQQSDPSQISINSGEWKRF